MAWPPVRRPTRCARRCSTRSTAPVSIDGAAVADLFAGSGALGIEALSRGAASCVFVERDRAALQALRANIAALGLAGRATVVTLRRAGVGAGAARRRPRLRSTRRTSSTAGTAC